MEIDPATNQLFDKVRALIAIGMYSDRGMVLATDSSELTYDIDIINNFTEDLGIDTRSAEGPGLYLWEGTAKTVTSCNGPDGYDTETEYTGTIRPVTMEELPALLAMEEPDLPDDGRETIAPGDEHYYRTPGEGGPG